MKVLVTGSGGHLGEGLVRKLRDRGEDVISIDIREGDFTSDVGSIVDAAFARDVMSGVDAVIHAATLHKPHVATHSRQDFVDTNITGTLNLLEAAHNEGVNSFVFTSTTSTFGDAMTPDENSSAVWVDESLQAVPKNIYGVTKLAAENLCSLFFKKFQLPCLVLRTSRFFPEDDDSVATRESYLNDNAKANEFLFRRVDLHDAVEAHFLATEKAPELGFDTFVISATSPFAKEDLARLKSDAPEVVRRYVDYDDVYDQLGWSMFPSIERVYSNERARKRLGWAPLFDFNHVIDRLRSGEPFVSELAQSVGAKGYHDHAFADGPYPIDN